jgi:hypothetical protein
VLEGMNTPNCAANVVFPVVLSSEPPSVGEMWSPLSHDEPSEKENSDDSDAKKMVRILKNRQAAKRSRELARQHLEMLERNVTMLSQESQMLMHRLALVEAENVSLRERSLWINQSVALDRHECHRPPQKKSRGGYEPAALNCPSLQRMYPLLLFFVIAAQLLPMQNKSTSLIASSLETRLGGLKVNICSGRARLRKSTSVHNHNHSSRVRLCLSFLMSSRRRTQQTTPRVQPRPSRHYFLPIVLRTIPSLSSRNNNKMIAHTPRSMARP